MAKDSFVTSHTKITSKKDSIQGFHLVLSIVMPFRERVNLSLIRCHFSTDTGPFDGQ